MTLCVVQYKYQIRKVGAYMKKKVWGKTEVYVYAIVDVSDTSDNDEIIDAAANEIGGLTMYCGNGGTDKLCGVYGENVGLECSYSEIEWCPRGEEDIEEAE